MSTNAAIVTIYESDSVEVVWDSVTGKVRVKPDGEWCYPTMYEKWLNDSEC